MQTGWLTIRRRSGITGTVFMTPWIIGFFVFTAFPMLYSIWLSVCSVNFELTGISTEFVGIKWYTEALREDPNFIPQLIDTIKFIGFLTPMILVVSVLFAVLLNRQLKGKGFFRALFFFPVVFINGPVMNKLIGNDATSIIRPEDYSVYRIIETLPDIISIPLIYIFDNVVMILWFSGVQILTILTSLQKINGSLYEAASIDGASGWQVFWKITLPSLKPMLLVSAVYTIVDLSNYSGNKITAYIKTNMTATQKTYSYSAAMSWMYSVCVLLLLLLAFIILNGRRQKNDL